MSTVKANTLEPASGVTVTINGAALTTPALGTPASGTLTNCTGLPASTGLSGTTLASNVVNASINAITPTGGTVSVTGALTLSGNATWNAFSLFNGGASHNDGNKSFYYEPGTTTYVTVHSPSAGVLRFGNSVGGLWDVTGGAIVPVGDNLYSVATAGNRSSVVYSATGAINTSDAREKTDPRPLTDAEKACALELAKMGPGMFQWLDSVAKKGENARWHVGFTVQQVMAVMQKHGLDPARYGCVCYDTWGDQFDVFPEVPARPAVAAQPARYEKRIEEFLIVVDGEEVEAEREYLHELSPAVAAQPAVEYQPERRVQTQWAGDRWGFRSDQLDRWIASVTMQVLLERAGL